MFGEEAKCDAHLPGQMASSFTASSGPRLGYEQEPRAVENGRPALGSVMVLKQEINESITLLQIRKMEFPSSSYLHLAAEQSVVTL